MRYFILPVFLTLTFSAFAAPRGNEQAQAERAQLKAALPQFLINEYAFMDGTLFSGLSLFSLPTPPKGPWRANETYNAFKAKAEEALVIEKKCAVELKIGKNQVNFAALSDGATPLNVLEEQVNLLTSKTESLALCVQALIEVIGEATGLEAEYTGKGDSEYAQALATVVRNVSASMNAVREYVEFEAAQLALDRQRNDAENDAIIDEFEVGPGNAGAQPEPMGERAVEVQVEVPAVAKAEDGDAQLGEINNRIVALTQATAQLDGQLELIEQSGAQNSQEINHLRARFERQSVEIAGLMSTIVAQRGIQVKNNDANALAISQLQRDFAAAQARYNRNSLLVTCAVVAGGLVWAYNNPTSLIQAGEYARDVALPLAQQKIAEGYAAALPVALRVWEMLPTKEATIEFGNATLQAAQPYAQSAWSYAGNATQAVVSAVRAQAGL